MGRSYPTALRSRAEQGGEISPVGVYLIYTTQPMTRLSPAIAIRRCFERWRHRFEDVGLTGVKLTLQDLSDDWFVAA